MYCIPHQYDPLLPWRFNGWFSGNEQVITKRINEALKQTLSGKTLEVN